MNNLYKDNVQCPDLNGNCDTSIKSGELLNKSCQVSHPIRGNWATAELHLLIRKVSEHYGGDDNEFLLGYINEILINHSIRDALTCLRTLVAELSPIIKWK